MPGQYQISLDQVGREADDLQMLGVPGVLLFGLPATKDDAGSEAYDDGGIVQDAVRAFKDVAPDLVVITDVCLCEYTEPRPLRRRPSTARSTTTRRSSCSRARRSRTRAPAPTSSRRRT